MPTEEEESTTEGKTSVMPTEEEESTTEGKTSVMPTEEEESTTEGHVSAVLSGATGTRKLEAGYTYLSTATRLQVNLKQQWDIESMQCSAWKLALLLSCIVGLVAVRFVFTSSRQNAVVTVIPK
nr:unnamed protein product [Spirometra erinaceieuropaei]